MLLDGTEVNLIIAFIAGILTFFASCLLPLVPSYLAFLSGVTFTSDNEASVSKKIFQSPIFVASLLFTSGFISVFVLLGATANVVGNFFALNHALIQKLGGIFLVVMGLVMLGLFSTSPLGTNISLDFKKIKTKWKNLNSLLFGFIFGFAWTPCIGPVLAVILFWASQAASALNGIFLLFVYGLGLGLPFVLIGAFFNYFAPKLSGATKFGYYLNKIAAVIIIIMGVLLITGKLSLVSIFLVEFFGISSLAA